MSELRCQDFTVVQNGRTLFSNVTIDFPDQQVTGLLGDRNSGILALLRALNRMLELDGPIDVSGQVFYKGQKVYSRKTKPQEIRKMVVTIPSNPLPLPGSIYDHVATGLRIRRWSRPVAMADRVEQALEAVDLWEELGPRLSEPAASVCPAQIPRLALASALAVSPTHILWAEPGGGLDPVETDLLDKALRRASSKCTVIIATNQVRQSG